MAYWGIQYTWVQEAIANTLTMAEQYSCQHVAVCHNIVLTILSRNPLLRL